MRPLTELELSKLEWESNSEGFTIWMDNGTVQNPNRRWLVDASVVKRDGRITISEPTYERPYGAVTSIDGFGRTEIKLVCYTH